MLCPQEWGGRSTLGQRLTGVWATLWLASAGLHAQLPGGTQVGMNAAMLKLFGDITAFSSKADVRLQEKGQEPMTMTINFAMLEGNVRVDLDMSNVKCAQLSAEILASYKSAGMERVTTILRRDRKSALLIYPSVQGYVELPMSREEARDMERRFKIDKTKLGRETIEGRACDKTRVVVSADAGEKQEAVVWYAQSLKDFPLRMQMDQPRMTMTMQYRDVSLNRPETRQFDAPVGFSKYASVEQLVQKAMRKALSGKTQP